MWAEPKPHKVLSTRCLETARQIGSAENDERAEDLIRKVRTAIGREPDRGSTTLAADQGAPLGQNVDGEIAPILLGGSWPFVPLGMFLEVAYGYPPETRVGAARFGKAALSRQFGRA